MMIKLVYVVQARDDVADDEFHRYWLEEHGPLVASVAADIRARKYVQSHTIDTPLNQVLVDSRGMAPIHHGITEVWWDSVAELQAAMATQEGAKAAARLLEDEAKFIDFSRSTIFLTEEHTIFDR
jgi:uncharacterized protein (TIGR02118 family)